MSKHSRKPEQAQWIATRTPERRALLLITLLSFLLLRLLQFLFAGKYPTSYPDSGTYRVEPEGWFDFSLVSSQARPTLVTIFYALFPDDPTRVFVQWLLSTASWLVLMGGVVALFVKFWVALIASISVWVLGLSYYAIQWDSLILSESLSITTTVLGTGLLIWWWANRRSWLLIASIAAFGLTALNRPNLWVLLVGLIVIIFLLARTIKLSSPVKWSAIALAVFFLILGITQQRVNDANFSGREGLDRIGWSYASMLSDVSPLSTSLLPSLIGSGIPNCMIPQKPFVSEEGPINIIVGLQNSCPKGVRWVNENFLVWYAGFLVTDPIRTLNALGDLVGPSSQALPYAPDSQIEPPKALKNLLLIQDPGSAWTLLVVSLTAGLVSLIVQRRTQRIRFVQAFLILELSFILSWANGVLLQVWDLHRTIVTNVVGINLVALLLIAAALDSFQSNKTKTEKAA